MNKIKPILSLIFLCAAFAAWAHPLDQWYQRYAAPVGVFPYDITHGEGFMVAVGSSGLIVDSPDGTNWTSRVAGTTQILRSVASGNGQWVVVGHSGTILSSLDRTNWTPRISGTTRNLMAVQYGNGVFVASGEFGVILTSPDGVTWVPHNQGTGFLNHLAYGKGLFLLAAGRGTNLVSADGANWFTRTNGSSANLYTLDFGNDQFLAIDTQSRILTSIDASNWTARGSVRLVRPPQTAYGNGVFLAVGGGPPEYSPDGDPWTQSTSNLSARAVTFDNGYFYLMRDTGIWQSDPVVQLQSTTVDTLSIAGPTNQTYQIESSENIADLSAWQIVTNITLSAGPQSWTDPRPSVRQRFYRAVLSP